MFFARNSKYNLAGPCHVHNSTLAELIAIREALLMIAYIDTPANYEIYTDSLNATSFVEGRMHVGRAYATVVGQIKRYQRAVDGTVEYKYVKGHTGIFGNDCAHYLASVGRGKAMHLHFNGSLEHYEPPFLKPIGWRDTPHQRKVDNGLRSVLEVLQEHERNLKLEAEAKMEMEAKKEEANREKTEAAEKAAIKAQAKKLKQEAMKNETKEERKVRKKREKKELQAGKRATEAKRKEAKAEKKERKKRERKQRKLQLLEEKREIKLARKMERKELKERQMEQAQLIQLELDEMLKKKRGFETESERETRKRLQYQKAKQLEKQLQEAKKQEALKRQMEIMSSRRHEVGLWKQRRKIVVRNTLDKLQVCTLEKRAVHEARPRLFGSLQPVNKKVLKVKRKTIKVKSKSPKREVKNLKQKQKDKQGKRALNKTIATII